MKKKQEEIDQIRQIIKRIDTKLLEKKIKRPEICKMLGISTSSFTDWEGGATPSFYTIVRIANTLGISLDLLVYDKIPHGLSALSYKIALTSEDLSDDGKTVALDLVKSLIKRFPNEKGEFLRKSG